MDSRSEADMQQADDIRARLRRDNLDGQLTAYEIGVIIKLYQQVYRAFSLLGPVDKWAVTKIKEVLMPHLTLIWHGEPRCTCRRGGRGGYSIGRKIHTSSELTA